MSEKRILITEVSGECWNLRRTSAGTYCAACPHGGWEKIGQEDCEKCESKKYLDGVSFKEAVGTIARIICNHKMGKCPEKEYHCDNCWADSNTEIAEEILKSLLH